MEDLKEYFESRNTVLPVILAGGTGSRLWPLSRESQPKQYLKLEENSEYSLLQNTFLRLKGIENLENPLIVCNEDQRFLVAEQMRKVNIIPKSIILEPFGKNTAPAIALAALFALKKDYDPLLLILSADHIIKDCKVFRKTINKGLKYAEQGDLVTFGTTPSHPETGYGYIEAIDELSDEISSSKIRRFIEKPDKNLAEKLINNKHFSWNCGIFLFKASIILKEIEKYQPKIFESCIKSFLEDDKDFNFQRIHKESFEKCPSMPIDVAVMEKTSLGRVLSLDVGWSDIGSWESLWKNSTRDEEGNFFKGKVITKDTKNCYIRSEDRLVVGLGIENTIVVETNDAILVSDKKSTQDVKEIVKRLEISSFKEGKTSRRVYRPWGDFTSLMEDKMWQVKKLEIKPLASLSLQMHHHRSEHWIVVKGTAKVEIDDKISVLNINESIYVPLGSIHRITNTGKITLVIIEVQSGTYLGEDDIVRFEDKYGRQVNQRDINN